MVITASPCELPKTNAEKNWPYVQYYVGDKDKEQRKNGEGDNCWSGAKSLERYTGHIVRDTMHGEGNYRWRYLGPNGTFVTYEGFFFNNLLHGYGSVSYCDGRVFKGIFHGNMRWGPGIESHACVKEDVGLWNGTQLIRLCWRPLGSNIAPDLMSSLIGRDIVKPHRKIMCSSIKTMGQVNAALELLKRNGANPLTAIDKWNKLYPKYCTDLFSALCHTEMFEHEYYNGMTYTLEECVDVPESAEITSLEYTQDVGNFYAWNNNDVMKHMMRHCYKNECQRKILDLDISSILSGPRTRFKPAGQHEIDSRTLLMASYLGHISQVAQLINEKKVNPDIADVLGNTAVIYATCGEKADIVHLLVEAGANVNSYNDSCCTPLGVALIKLACVQKDIPMNSVLQALLPTYVAPTTPPREQVFEWLTSRNPQSPSVGPMLNKSPSKTNRSLSSKKIKSLASLKEQTGGKKKSEPAPPKIPEQTSDESFSEEKRVYNNINREFSIRLNDVYQPMNLNPIPYLFEVNDMVKEIDASEEDHKKIPDKNPKKVISKVLKEATKPSKDAMWQNDKDENTSVDSVEKLRRDSITRIMATIFQLLSDGADPKIVKCPQPALFTAIISGSSEAVTHLICYGADINEVYPMVLGYTALDIALSQPFTYDNLEIIKVLLEHGADTLHRLEYDTTNDLKIEVLGPTLLHAVLARRTESETEEEIRREILELLLDYNCIPTMQFQGKSAIDIAMTKSMDIFDIFIRNPKTNLNSVINDLHQTVLVKMFSLPFFKTIGGTDRLQKITDLLLFGANPLVECQNGVERYENIFVFAKKTLFDLEGTNPTKSPTPSGAAGKKLDKAKKEDKISTKSLGRMVDDVGEYKQALDLVTECARLLHIRWLQAKLIKELMDVVKKYSHRHWSMILKELKCKKNIGLWVSPQRSLEIWNILANAKKKAYSNRNILKHVLNIVQFCSYRIMNTISFRKPVTVVEKEIVEKNTSSLLHEQKDSESLNSEVLWKRCYVKPELITNADKIFNVCFECALPLLEDKITCISCKLVTFCSFECIRVNINRVNCHPCNVYLKEKYFPSNSDSIPPDF